ncbi:hypothetical protein BDV93DRAFT_511479 [Ceratobasidium sp. AG-I]|nr:hypothetical protein BDV93DRAFT_511479 [Ceratobasidium sp. AG-I]
MPEVREVHQKPAFRRAGAGAGAGCGLRNPRNSDEHKGGQPQNEPGIENRTARNQANHPLTLAVRPASRNTCIEREPQQCNDHRPSCACPTKSGAKGKSGDGFRGGGSGVLTPSGNEPSRGCTYGVTTPTTRERPGRSASYTTPDDAEAKVQVGRRGGGTGMSPTGTSYNHRRHLEDADNDGGEQTEGLEQGLDGNSVGRQAQDDDRGGAVGSRSVPPGPATVPDKPHELRRDHLARARARATLSPPDTPPTRRPRRPPDRLDDSPTGPSNVSFADAPKHPPYKANWVRQFNTLAAGVEQMAIGNPCELSTSSTLPQNQPGEVSGNKIENKGKKNQKYSNWKQYFRTTSNH